MEEQQQDLFAAAGISTATTAPQATPAPTLEPEAAAAVATQKEADTRPKAVLVDTSNWLYRAYFAVKFQKPMTAPPTSKHAGMHTGAALAFSNMLAKLIREQQPDVMVATLDVAKKTNRHDVYPEYKSNRPPMPQDLKAQIPIIYEIIRAFGVPTVGCEGFEADDIQGTLAKLYKKLGYRVVIATGDKDAMQLVEDGHITLVKDDNVIDEAQVLEKFGVKPNRVVDVLALWGDASDCIPGVPGYGEEKAKSAIQGYGSLDGLLNRADEVTGVLGQNLRANMDKAIISYQLATIIDNLLPEQINFMPEQGRYNGPEVDLLQGIFSDLGFSSINAQTVLMGTEERKLFRKRQQGIDAMRQSGDAAPAAPAPAPEPAVEVRNTPLGGILFSFGKYRSKSVDEVAALNRDYLVGLLENAPNLTADLRTAIEQALGA